MSYAPASVRGAVTALLALDDHLGNLIRQASEPMLAQMRLAWWRQELANPPETRARGNPILAAIAEHWQVAEVGLIEMVDGWENILAEPPISVSVIQKFASGRAQPWVALGEYLEASVQREAISLAGQRWALADLCSQMQPGEERDLAFGVAENLSQKGNGLPKALRSLAILDGLARKSLASGGTPLFSGRRSALIALRLGMFGR